MGAADGLSVDGERVVVGVSVAGCVVGVNVAGFIVDGFVVGVDVAGFIVGVNVAGFIVDGFVVGLQVVGEAEGFRVEVGANVVPGWIVDGCAVTGLGVGDTVVGLSVCTFGILV